MEQTPGNAERKGPKVTGRTRALVVALDRGIFVFARHWVLAFSLFLVVYAGVPFLAPVFMYVGWEAPARVIYAIYSPLCHQLGYRSYYLFGERPNYSRYVFAQDTGIDPDTYDGFIASRAFIGNKQMGYKVALCERDVAIYGVMVVGGLIFGLPGVRRRVKPMKWWAWILIGIVPIGLDGFWQLFTNYPYSTTFHFLTLLPYHESSPFWRSLTGGLFGLANIWLAYPYFEESMREARDELKIKLARVDAEAAQRKAQAPAD
jgi:uncharacterized membrane protein